MNSRSFSILCALILGVSLAISGCTITPRVVASPAPSWDGNEQNSGIIAVLPDGYLVTFNYRKRYNKLIELYGSKFVPALQQDDGIIRVRTDGVVIDREHAGKMALMSTWARSAGRSLDPPNPPL
jgi:hypothetical protein